MIETSGTKDSRNYSIQNTQFDLKNMNLEIFLRIRGFRGSFSYKKLSYIEKCA